MPDPELVPDLHLGNSAPFLAHRLAVPGCIVITSAEDGSIGLTAHGVNHARANEMLSVAIYMNLQQHYDLVRAGAAGPEAAEQQRDLDAMTKKAVTQ